MEREIKDGYRTAVIDLDGGECEVKFDSVYTVFSVTSDSEVTVALESGKSAGDDGVMTCPAGESIMYPHMQRRDKLYITGSGRVQVFASNDAVNPFKKAGKGGEIKENRTWDFSYDGYANDGNTLIFIHNAKYNSGYDLCGYNCRDYERNRLGISKSYSGYNLSHFMAVDFTDVKSIVIKGAVKSNLAELTSTVRCFISPEITDAMLDEWTVVKQALGNTALNEFSFTLDCTEIMGENYLHLAVEHGAEISSYTSYLYLDKIDFVY